MSAPSNTEPPIRCGDWRHALAGVTADCLISDPPYSARTHSGSEINRGDGRSTVGHFPSYFAWSPDDVGEFVASWSPRIRGWMVALTDSELIGCWRAAFEACGRYAFAPVPCVMRGMSVRLSGDGPSSWAVYAMVARPATKAFVTWGTLDGAYTGNRGTDASAGRGKPDWLMRALVRDYSRPGDLVIDPCAGWGTTLTAAIGLGRRALGAEIDPAVCAEGNSRIARGSQTELFA
jgi:site-specific DNA-methyltransferase (adenine-specific)